MHHCLEQLNGLATNPGELLVSFVVAGVPGLVLAGVLGYAKGKFSGCLSSALMGGIFGYVLSVVVFLARTFLLDTQDLSSLGSLQGIFYSDGFGFCLLCGTAMAGGILGSRAGLLLSEFLKKSR